MAEIRPSDILLRVGGRTWQRHGALAVSGSGRSLIELPYTFTRADGVTPLATFIDRDLTTRTAAADKVRIEYPSAYYGLVDAFGYPVCGPSLEGGRSNACIWTEALDTATSGATYTKFQSSITANAIAAPDGQLTADKLVEDGTNNAHAIFGNTVAIADGQVTAASIFLKAGERSKARCFLVDSLSVVGRWADVDLAAGIISNTGTTGGAPGALVQPWFLEKRLNGWWRLGVAFNVGAGKLDTMWNLHMNQAFGTDIYLGDSASGLYPWGWQIEVGQNFVGSYIPRRTAAAAARAADSFTLPLNVGLMASTLHCDFIHPSSDAGVRGVFHLGAPGAGARIFELNWGGTKYRVTHGDAATGYVEAQAVAAPNVGDRVRIAACLYADGHVTIEQAINSGAAAAAVANGTTKAFTALTQQVLLGRRDVGFEQFSPILESKLLRNVRTLAECEAVP
jgi:hypothetical protein